MANEDDTLELNCGEMLQLQAINEVDRRCYVKIIGSLPGGSIVVTAPSADGKLMLVREGKAFTARAFAGNQALAFNCTVLRVCMHPYPYLHLSYPEQFKRVTVRKAYRVPVHLTATVTISASNGTPRVVPVRIVDLSSTGALLESADLFAPPGERVGLSAQLPLESMDALAVAVFGRVRSVAEPGQAQGGALHRIGLEFEALDASSQVALRAFVYEQMFKLGTV